MRAHKGSGTVLRDLPVSTHLIFIKNYVKKALLLSTFNKEIR